ncbi:hypothetical protein J3R83DRAFT_11522 [Lanmaoa asiatica]|nr:hypothetical protein J3R83DRAFT_11522 [Lanmaoa asiatica]
MQTAPNSQNTHPQINTESDWLHSLTITTTLWFARMSILCSIVRITNPTPKLRRIAYCIGVMFLAMEAALLAQKIFICVKDLCRITNAVAIAQLVTDVISDIILVAAPVRFLRDVQLPRDRRILIISVFSTSILITGITILHSVLLLDEATNRTVTIGHIKATLALFLCNALVIVMFFYRLRRRSGVDLDYCMAEGCGDGMGSNAVEFTSVIDLPSKFSSRSHHVTSGIQS